MGRIWTPGEDWGSYLSWSENSQAPLNTLIQFDWEKLIEAGCRFCSFKSDQEQWDSFYGNYSTKLNLEAARKAGVKVNGVYVWFFPHVNQNYWIDRYTKSIESEKPDFIEVDAEQVSFYGEDENWHVPSPQVVADNLMALCEGLISRFPELPFLLYTRPDYIKVNATPCVPYITKYDFHTAGWPDWGADVYELPLADRYAGKSKQVLSYTPVTTRWVNIIQDNFNPPKVSNENILIWQSSSRIIPTYAGRTSYATHQYDTNFFLNTEEELLKWAKKVANGGEVITPPEIITPPIEEPPVIPPEEEVILTTKLFNTATPQSQRAKILTLTQVQAKAGQIAPKDLGIDAIILEMGGMIMEGSYCKVKAYPSFPARCAQFSEVMPVIGQYEISAANWLADGNLTAPKIEKPLKENIMVKSLMDAWHDGAWTWDKILTKNGKWRKISALELKLTTTIGFNGAIVGNDWQNRVLGTMLERIKFLMDGGFVPNIPVILYTGPWWLVDYDKPDTPIYLTLQKYKDWLWLRLGQWIRFSTATFNTLNEIFAFPPDDSFEFFVKDQEGKIIYRYPDGYFEKIFAHEFSGECQKSKTIVDSSGNPSAVTLSLAYDTKEKIYSILKFAIPAVEEPQIPPPETPPQTEVSGLEKIMEKLNLILEYLEKIWNKIISIFK